MSLSAGACFGTRERSHALVCETALNASPPPPHPQAFWGHPANYPKSHLTRQQPLPLPAVIPLVFVSNPKAAASTTSLSLIGRRKCIEKQIAFSVTGLWFREAPGWVREQLESSRELPHIQSQLVFPEPFCRPSYREAMKIQASGLWRRCTLHIFLRPGVK